MKKDKKNKGLAKMAGNY